MQKSSHLRQEINSQLIENEMVKTELELLKSENQVYKLVGPVLIKIDQVEAKHNVSNRIEYIKEELKRIEDILGGLEKKQESCENNLRKYEQQFQQAQLKAAIQS